MKVKLSVSLSDHQAILMSALQDHSSFLDTTLVCGDGQVKVNRLLLALLPLPPMALGDLPLVLMPMHGVQEVWGFLGVTGQGVNSNKNIGNEEKFGHWINEPIDNPGKGVQSFKYPESRSEDSLIHPKNSNTEEYFTDETIQSLNNMQSSLEDSFNHPTNSNTSEEWYSDLKECIETQFCGESDKKSSTEPFSLSSPMMPAAVTYPEPQEELDVVSSSPFSSTMQVKLKIHHEI